MPGISIRLLPNALAYKPPLSTLSGSVTGTRARRCLPQDALLPTLLNLEVPVPVATVLASGCAGYAVGKLPRAPNYHQNLQEVIQTTMRPLLSSSIFPALFPETRQAQT